MQLLLTTFETILTKEEQHILTKEEQTFLTKEEQDILTKETIAHNDHVFLLQQYVQLFPITVLLF